MKISEKFIASALEISTFEKCLPAPYLRKEFDIEFEADFADITICGLGFYELYINGENVTKGMMAPYISNPNDICYYDTYDISKKLKKGKNVIGVLLGHGFRNPFGGFVWDFDKGDFVGPVCLALLLRAGNETNIFELEADETFKTHDSPVIFNEYRMGYHYDSRLEIPGWNTVGFDDSSWNNAIKIDAPKGEKKICSFEPISVRNIRRAREVKHLDEFPLLYDNVSTEALPVSDTIVKDVYVYDFGVNSAGITRIEIDGLPGQKITVYHGELVLDDKYIINTTYFSREKKFLKYQQTDVFICKGGKEIFEPKFKYDGFRYAAVEGLTQEQATSDAVIFIEMNSDVKERAGFLSSDDTLNRLQEMTRQSDLSNFYYFPTDCPHREKNGWTGDIALSAERHLLTLSAENSLKEFLANVRCAQREDGALPGIVPTGGWGFDWSRGPAWDAVCIEVPYYLYRFTGKVDVIEDNAEMMINYLKYVKSTLSEEGFVDWGLGDWRDPLLAVTGKYTAPKKFTNSAEIYKLALYAKFLFEQVEKNEEAQYAAGLAREIKQAIRNELIDFDEMSVIGNCQTSQAMAINIGIFDDSEVNRAGKKLVEIINRDGNVTMCGVLGMRHIFHALTDVNEENLAYELIVSKAPTCYGNWVKQGSTTLWESLCEMGKDSHNHHMFGDISSWFIQDVGGIKPNPSLNNINYVEISPHFIEKLSFVEAYYVHKHGKLSVRWERFGKVIKIKVSIPEGVKSFLRLPPKYRLATGSTECEINVGESCIAVYMDY